MAKYDKLIEHFYQSGDEFRRFKTLYQLAEKKQAKEFVFVFPWGQEWPVDMGYAKYFIEYIKIITGGNHETK
jgi:hypothetical protein